MAAADMVTLGPEAEAAEVAVGVGTLDTKAGVEVGVGTLDTAPLVEANGRERILRADGDDIIGCRALGIKVMEHLGFNRLLPPLQILMGVKR